MNSLPYGDDNLNFKLPWDHIEIIAPHSTNPDKMPHVIIQEALNNPFIDKNRKQNRQFAGKKVGIAINDQTRPLPHAIILPELLTYLEQRGVKGEDITFFIATGTHRELTDNELKTVLPGDLADKYTWRCHICDDENELIYIGYTSIRTQVYINKEFYQSDLKIVVGNIEPHHFMGFSGGMKTASIGLAGRATIEKNHSLLTDPNAKLGIYSENPMRRDVEEIGRMIGVDYALNVVLNDEKEIIASFWGYPQQVMAAGIPVALKASQVDKNIKDCGFDLIIASVGGYPKDINFYQAQKALTNACLFSKPKGVIILAAECRDGFGNKKFEKFMQDKQSWQQILDCFGNQPFQLGPHKAYLIARQAVDHKIILISNMPDETVQQLLLTPAADIPSALNLAQEHIPSNPRVALLPYATHSLPRT